MKLDKPTECLTGMAAPDRHIQIEAAEINLEIGWRYY